MSLDDEVARLRELDHVAIRARWRAVTGRAAPKQASAALLLRLLAYRVQADAHGDLSPQSQRLLARIGDGAPVPPPSRPPTSGTILTREWNGARHHVTAVTAGYAWNGATYDSLSQVAHAITGTKWNGPRFFGLRDGVCKKARTARTDAAVQLPIAS